jgi:protoporphyrinogen oxidase
MNKSANKTKNRKVVVIGGGPAGLTASYQLSKAGVESAVLEKDQTVGGISKTVNYRDYHFDIGGHRFFTKIDQVEQMWRDVLRDDFLKRNRLSRIYYDGRFFYYPLRPLNALRRLGLWNSFLILGSYLLSRLMPSKQEETFEQWVSNRFGKRLYHIFSRPIQRKSGAYPVKR